jgi:hypothetical protein
MNIEELRNILAQAMKELSKTRITPEVVNALANALDRITRSLELEQNKEEEE